MQHFMAIVATLWLIAGVYVWSRAGSVMHEILACLLLSFGMIMLGLAGIIDELCRRRRKRVRASPTPVPTTGEVAAAMRDAREAMARRAAM